VIILFAPDHAGEGLSLDASFLRICHVALQIGVEFVCLFTAGTEDLIEIAEWRSFESVRPPQPQLYFSSGGHGQWEMSGALCPTLRAVHRRRVAVDQIFVEGILEILRRVLNAVKASCIRLVVRE